MKQIEFERWEPDAENPRRLTYAGQRTAEDVFHELEAQLDSVGYLPDEYFTMDWRWEHGRQIPKGAYFFCKTDYGGSEGIYLDVYLEWQEGDKPKKECFITGKTLGESGADLDRMFLISAAITKAFRGDNSVHARYMVVGGQPGPVEPLLLHLTPDEQQSFLDYAEAQDCTPSLSQAQKLKAASKEGTLTLDKLEEIMSAQKPSVAPREPVLNINVSKVAQYFPTGCTKQQMENRILKILESYFRQMAHEQAHEEER